MALFIAEYETLPNDIIALNFNLWEAVEENGQSCYTLELTGSKQYDVENDDWACEEDFDPRERNCRCFATFQRNPVGGSTERLSGEF